MKNMSEELIIKKENSPLSFLEIAVGDKIYTDIKDLPGMVFVDVVTQVDVDNNEIMVERTTKKRKPRRSGFSDDVDPKSREAK